MTTATDQRSRLATSYRGSLLPCTSWNQTHDAPVRISSQINFVRFSLFSSSYFRRKISEIPALVSGSFVDKTKPGDFVNALRQSFLSRGFFRHFLAVPFRQS